MTTLASAFLLAFFAFIYGVLLGMGLTIKHITKKAKQKQSLRIDGKCYVFYEKHGCDGCGSRCANDDIQTAQVKQ